MYMSFIPPSGEHTLLQILKAITLLTTKHIYIHYMIICHIMSFLHEYVTVIKLHMFMNVLFHSLT